MRQIDLQYWKKFCESVRPKFITAIDWKTSAVCELCSSHDFPADQEFVPAKGSQNVPNAQNSGVLSLSYNIVSKSHPLNQESSTSSQTFDIFNTAAWKSLLTKISGF